MFIVCYNIDNKGKWFNCVCSVQRTFINHSSVCGYVGKTIVFRLWSQFWVIVDILHDTDFSSRFGRCVYTSDYWVLLSALKNSSGWILGWRIVLIFYTVWNSTAVFKCLGVSQYTGLCCFVTSFIKFFVTKILSELHFRIMD